MESKIENVEALTRIFGCFPSFHDAEVLSVHLDREGHNGFLGPTLEIKIHVFEMTGSVNEKGYYVLVNHTLATFLFCQVSNLRFADFNGQNVIDGFSMKDAASKIEGGPALEVTFFPCYGMDLEFGCQAVKLISAEPFVPEE